MRVRFLVPLSLGFLMTGIGLVSVFSPSPLTAGTISTIRLEETWPLESLVKWTAEAPGWSVTGEDGPSGGSILRYESARLRNSQSRIDLKLPLPDWRSTAPAVVIQFETRLENIRLAENSGTFLFQLLDSHDSSVVFQSEAIPADQEWRRFSFPVDMASAAVPRQVSFSPGDTGQVIEISGLRLLQPEEAYPDPAMAIQGFGRNVRDSVSDWRSQAMTRIRNHRQALLQFTILENNGLPADGATISVVQEEHAFPFGVALPSLQLDELPDSRSPQIDIVHEFFNAVHLSSDELPGATEVLRDLGKRIIVSWTPALEPAMNQTGIGSIDPGMADLWILPIENALLPPTELETTLSRLLPRFVQALPETAFFLQLPIGVFDPMAREGDLAAWASEIRLLLAQGMPFAGLALNASAQGWYFPEPESVLRRLDLLARTELPLLLLNWSFPGGNESLRVDLVREFLGAAFSHPAVIGIYAGQLSAVSANDPGSRAFFDQNWEPRPHFSLLSQIIFQEWWTETEARTDHEGNARISSFQGKVAITVTSPDGRRLRFPIFVGRDGAHLRLTLP